MSQITSHILDITRGKPASNVPVTLFVQDGQWRKLSGGVTNSDGRVADLLADDVVLPAGIYRLHFVTSSYFAANSEAGFYPYVDIVFEIDGTGTHYHVPLLLSAYGYSTYRGS